MLDYGSSKMESLWDSPFSHKELKMETQNKLEQYDGNLKFDWHNYNKRYIKKKLKENGINF